MLTNMRGLCRMTALKAFTKNVACRQNSAVSSKFLWESYIEVDLFRVEIPYSTAANFCDIRKRNINDIAGHQSIILGHTRQFRTNTCLFSSKDPEKERQKCESVAQKENILTVPNLLTSLRIAVTPYLGYLVLQEDFKTACIVFAVAGISDVADGYIARNFKNQMSTLGTALDPLADKFLVSTLTITLTMVNLFPVPLTVIILGRDVLLILAYCIIRYISIPSPKTVKKYFDASYATVDMKPSHLSKMNTFIQISTIISSLLAPVYNFTDSPLLQALWFVTGCTTILSGLDYAIKREKHINYRR